MMARKEGIKINEEALKTIAMSADGALRDAEVALSKIHACLPVGEASTDSTKAISVDEVNEMLGLVSYRYYPEFVSCLLGNDKTGALDLIQKIYLSGADLENFTGHLVEYMRKILMAKINPVVLASISGINDEETKSILALGQNTDGQKLIRIIVSFSNARNEIKHSPVPQLPLELAVIELCGT